MEKRPVKKMKILSFLASLISKIKKITFFHLLAVRYFSKGLLFLKIWHTKVSYCWNYGSSNLLFRFCRYCLGHLNNRQKKIEKLLIHFLKANTNTSVWCNFFDSPTTKWRSFKFFAKLDGNHILMANFSKLCKLVQLNCIIWAKVN